MITDISQVPPNVAVQFIDHLVRFKREHQGRIHIVKPSGKIIDNRELRREFAKEVVRLSRDFGLQVAVIHGAGVQITSALKNAGKESVFEDGLRVTKADHVEIADRATLETNTQLCEEIDEAGEGYVTARGMPGHHPDLNMISTPMDAANGNFSGEKVLSMSTGSLKLDLQKETVIPVITNMCQIDVPVNGVNKVNVNADSVASFMAIKLNAYRLLACSNVPGVLEPAHENVPPLPKDTAGIRDVIEKGYYKVIPEIKPDDVQGLLSRGIIDEGMEIKVKEMFATASRMGAGGAVVILDHNFSAETLMPQGYGTILRAPNHAGMSPK